MKEAPFSFSKETAEKAQEILRRYPSHRQASGVVPLLRLAQEQNEGWLSPSCIEYVAQYLAMPVIKVWEVASFYTMFNLAPVGKHLIQICRTTPCWLRGAGDLTQACTKHLGLSLGETTKEGTFTVVEVECLGACANAPVVQINETYYEDLTPETLVTLVDRLEKGEPVHPGSQVGRRGSEPMALSPQKDKRGPHAEG